MGEQDFAIERILALSGNKDYNPEMQMPIHGPYVQHTLAPASYLTTLEEIDPSWVYKYLDNMIYGAKVRRDDSFRSLNRGFKLHRMTEQEDGKFLTEGEDLVTEYAFTLEEEEEWRRRLPQAVKRIYTLSKDWGISLMSLIIAWEKLLRIKKPENIQIAEILRQGVYLMDGEGTLRSRLEKNKGVKWTDYAHPWIRGHIRNSYYTDYMYIREICEKLGISLYHEDPLEYDKSLCDNLIVTYIPSNLDYFNKKGSIIPDSVAKVLKSMDKSDYGKLSSSSETAQSITEVCYQLAVRLRLVRDPVIEPALEYRMEASEKFEFISLYNGVTRAMINPANVIENDEGLFLYDHNGEFFIMDIGFLCGVPSLPVIVHSGGFVIAVSDSPEISFAYLDDIKAAIKGYVNGMYCEIKWVKKR